MQEQGSLLMLTKRSVITLLLGLNLLLMAGLVIASTSLPVAYAQAGARPGDFVCVTAKAAGQSYDVLYLLDVRERKLHALYPASAARNPLVPALPRDLAADFQQR